MQWKEQSTLVKPTSSMRRSIVTKDRDVIHLPVPPSLQRLRQTWFSILDHDYDSGSCCSDASVVGSCRSIAISLCSISVVDVILWLADIGTPSPTRSG